MKQKVQQSTFPKKICPKCGNTYDGIYKICRSPSCKMEINGVISVPYLVVKREDIYGASKRRKRKKKSWKAKKSSGILETPENGSAVGIHHEKTQVEGFGHPKI